MNKKFIAILLIFSLLTVGLTSVTATESSSNDLVNTDVTDASSSSQGENNVGSSGDNNIADNNNTNETNETNTTERLSQVSNEDIYNMINDLNANQHDVLLESLKTLNNDQYKDIIALLSAENMTENDLSKLIDSLSDEEYQKLLDILALVQKFNFHQVSPVDSDKNNHQSNPFDAVLSIFNGNNNDNTEFKVSSVSKTTGQKFRNVLPSEAPINILEVLIDEYMYGRLTFDEFVKYLEMLNFDTTGITLNPDGSITWMGITIPGPTEIDTVDTNTTANDTTNTTNDSSSGTSSDNTRDSSRSDSSNNNQAEETSSNANSASSSASDISNE